MAGYSKKPLVEKLGIKSGQKIHLANPPRNYRATLGPLPDQVQLAKSLNGSCDLIQFFVQARSLLEGAFPTLKKHLATSGCLWVSWPKGGSQVKTDLNENVVREIGLRNGLVDIKVCAVDEVWSGLKFVFRLRDR